MKRVDESGPRRVPLVTITVAVGLLLLSTLVVVAAALPSRSGDSGSGSGSGGELARGELSVRATRYPVPEDALFVATDGNDSASGTRQAPLRTLSEAVDRAGSGDTIVLREGTYRESVGIVRKRLTIQPYPGEQVWLKGSVVLDEWERARHGWVHRGWNPRFCRDCYLPEIIDPEHPLAGLPDMVFVDGRPLRQVGERGDVGPGTFFVDTSERILLIGEDPRGRMVEAAAFAWLLQFDGDSAAGSVIRGIGIAHYAAQQEYGQRGAMVVVNAPSVRLENNTFAFSASSGAAVFQPAATVVGNTFVDNGLVGLMANRADGLRLTGNRFVGNNREHFALSGSAIGAAGVKITRTKRPVIEYNAFVDNHATGWWCDLGCTDAVVVGNVSRGNTVHGLYYEVSSTALIASNLVLDNGGKGLKISSSDHVRVLHNTFEGNSGAIGIYNDPRSPSFDPYSQQLGLSWITSHTVLVGNYFAGARGGTPFVFSADYKPESMSTPAFISRSDGNVYLRSGESPLAVWYLGSATTGEFPSLAALTARTGQGVHSIEAQRQRSPFRDPQAGDYRLRPEAPGAGDGLPLPPDVAAALGVDPRPNPDIGLVTRPGPR